MDDKLFRLKYWYRGKVTIIDVAGVGRAAHILTKVKATGAVLLYSDQQGINAGKWFNYQILK